MCTRTCVCCMCAYVIHVYIHLHCTCSYVFIYTCSQKLTQLLLWRSEVYLNLQYLCPFTQLPCALIQFFHHWLSLSPGYCISSNKYHTDTTLKWKGRPQINATAMWAWLDHVNILSHTDTQRHVRHSQSMTEQSWDQIFSKAGLVVVTYASYIQWWFKSDTEWVRKRSKIYKCRA